jgi:hypothetical protein
MISKTPATSVHIQHNTTAGNGSAELVGAGWAVGVFAIALHTGRYMGRYGTPAARQHVQGGICILQRLCVGRGGVPTLLFPNRGAVTCCCHVAAVAECCWGAPGFGVPSSCRVLHLFCSRAALAFVAVVNSVPPLGQGTCSLQRGRTFLSYCSCEHLHGRSAQLAVGWK